MVAALKGTPYDTGLDLEKLSEVSAYFRTLRKKYLDSGLLNPKMLEVDTNALIYQVPGGMLSNLVSQLKQAGKEDKLEEVLQEVPRVREDAGYPPLVTPVLPDRGHPGGVQHHRRGTLQDGDQGIQGSGPRRIRRARRCRSSRSSSKRSSATRTPITCRPADRLEPELEKMRDEMAEWYEQEEDVLTYAQFGQVAVKFFEKRRNDKYHIDGDHLHMEEQVHPV